MVRRKGGNDLVPPNRDRKAGRRRVLAPLGLLAPLLLASCVSSPLSYSPDPGARSGAKSSSDPELEARITHLRGELRQLDSGATPRKQSPHSGLLQMHLPIGAQSSSSGASARCTTARACEAGRRDRAMWTAC